MSQEKTRSHSGENVIRKAFYRSLLALLLLAAFGAGVWFFTREHTEPIVIEEAVVTGPVIETQAPPQVPPAVTFTDITREAGIDFVHTTGA